MREISIWGNYSQQHILSFWKEVKPLPQIASSFERKTLLSYPTHIFSFLFFFFSLFLFLPHGHHLAVSTMARAVSRNAGTPPCSAMTGSSAWMAWRSCGRLVCAKARNVADSSSNSDLWVERHTADQRVAMLDNTAMLPSS
jgi:hypothetical protein